MAVADRPTETPAASHPPVDPPATHARSGPEEAPPNLTRATLAGLQWSYGETIVSTVLKLAMAAVLARLLTPAAFGLVAISDLSLRFVSYFARAGVVQAVIQAPQLTAPAIRAAWVASLALGVTFWAAVWAAAPLAAELFGAPEATPVIRWMGMSMLLFGLGATAQALLRRELRFRALALRSVVSYVIGYAGVGLVMALAGAGVWALVAASLTQTFLNAALAFVARPHDVRPTADRTAYRSILGFGSRVSVISFFEFLGSELDTLAVSRFAGTGAVGLYNRAYLIALLPAYNLSTSLSKVLFPAMSSVQHDLPRFRSAYLSAVQVASGVIVPIAAGMAVAAPEIIHVLLGDQWLDAIPILPFIAGLAAVSMVNHFAGVATEARGLLRPKLGLVTARVVALAGLLALAAGGPLWGYGAALLGSELLLHGGYLWLMRRVADTTAREVGRQYAPSLVAAAIVAAAIAATRWVLLPLGAPLVVVLSAEVVAGTAALLVALRFGPLTAVRQEVGRRLRNAGVLEGGGRLAVTLRALVGEREGRA